MSSGRVVGPPWMLLDPWIRHVVENGPSVILQDVGSYQDKSDLDVWAEVDTAKVCMYTLGKGYGVVL